MKRFFKAVFCLLLLCAVLGAACYILWPEARERMQDSAARLGLTDRVRSVQNAVDGVLPQPVEPAPPADLIGSREIAHVLAAGMLGHQTAISMNVEMPAREEVLLAAVEDALMTVRREHPEIFWMGLGEYGIQWVNRGEYVHLVVELSYCYSSGEADAVWGRIDQALDLVAAATPDDGYEAAKYLHDWLVQNTRYDVDTAELLQMEGREYAFNANGALLDGLAVCEGYAKAYKLLCDRVGLPCRIVFGVFDGENHAWNYVQLGDGWYLVDCTSDDPVSSQDILRWDYFLRGSRETAGGAVIGEVYQTDGAGYPTLSQWDYQADEDGGERRSAPRQAATVERVNLLITAPLYAGTDSVEPGAQVGVVSASGSGSGFSYRLAVTGADDGRFALDPVSGVLRVGESALEAGGYQVMVEVTPEGGQPATALFTLEVAEEGAAGYQADFSPDDAGTRRSGGGPRRVA